ncbi:hypothetical protein [Streptomyces pactum]|uniref:hypothetical protein n=1 Tax=Streptomyces pactum TaxID=68249 RepID=UPI0027DE1A70|nr:hypothetical protein [Streptomyces pactum]
MTAVAAAALLFLAPTLTGCVTVHGERENIPSVARSEAPGALKRFVDTYNTAYRELDPDLLRRVETGPLEEIFTADLTAQRARNASGNPGFPPLELSDARYHIPKQVGWPKFFVADVRSNREAPDSGTRWLLVFSRDGAEERWRVAYLSILSRDEVPLFATDEDGWAEAVPTGRAGRLAVAPAALSKAYTSYLMTGEGPFAEGPSTTRLRDHRKQFLRTPKFWTEYIDTPAEGPRYAPVGLRTKDGGALVFFSSHHREKQTMAKGVRPEPAPEVKPLLKGEAKKAVTLTRLAESAVRIPARDAADPRVVFVNRMEGVTAAKGE